MTYTLYKHTFPNGKVYIGITARDPEKRWENGKGYMRCNKAGKPLQPAMYQAIKKYGWENVKHEIVLTTESQEEIEKYECQYITEVYHSNDKRYGYNIDAGGRYIGKVSDDTKELKRNLALGENNPAFGKHWYNNGIKQILTFEKPDETWTLGGLPVSDTTKERRKQYYKNHSRKCKGKKWFVKGNIKVCSDKCPEGFEPYTFSMPKDTVKHIAELHKGLRWWTNGCIQLLSKTCPSRNWRLGKLPLSEETKAKIRNKTVSDETKNKLKQYKGEKASVFGKKWFNNGIEEILTVECPQGFTKGRLKFSTEQRKKRSEINKNSHWYNNGEIQVFTTVCPENFVPGMLKKKPKESSI